MNRHVFPSNKSEHTKSNQNKKDLHVQHKKGKNSLTKRNNNLTYKNIFGQRKVCWNDALTLVLLSELSASILLAFFDSSAHPILNNISSISSLLQYSYKIGNYVVKITSHKNNYTLHLQTRFQSFFRDKHFAMILKQKRTRKKFLFHKLE